MDDSQTDNENPSDLLKNEAGAEPTSTSPVAIPIRELIQKAGQIDGEFLRAEGCSKFMLKSRGAVRYNFTLACVDIQSMGVTTVSGREISTFPKGNWTECIQPIGIFPTLYVNPSCK